MTGKVLDFTERPFITSRDIALFVAEGEISTLPAQMDFCRELTGVFRQLSPRLFASEEDRARLVGAAQEHLDALVSAEESEGPGGVP